MQQPMEVEVDEDEQIVEQWVLGHAHLSTTQLYVTTPVEDMIAAVVAHHNRRAEGPSAQANSAAERLSYRPESLAVLFGRANQ